MTKKTKAPATTFTITIPDSDEVVKTALLTVQREKLGILHRFQFSTIDDILHAMAAAARKLADTQSAPPAVTAQQETGDHDDREDDQDNLAHPSVVITLTTSDEGTLLREALVTARRGDLGAIHRFQFSTMAQIGAALQKVTTDLVSAEMRPPLYFPYLEPDVNATTEQVTVALYAPPEGAVPATDNPIPNGEIACAAALPGRGQQFPGEDDNDQLSMF